MASRASARRRCAWIAIFLGLLPVGTPSAGKSATPALVGPASFLTEECPAEFSLRGEVRKGSEGALAGSATVFFHHRSPESFLALEFSASRVRLTRTRGGVALLLAQAPLRPWAGTTLPFTLKRRSHQIALIVEGRTLVRAYDDETTGGRIGWQGPRGVAVTLRLQPTETVYFDDDFTRAPDEPAGWDALSGGGRITGVDAGNFYGKQARYSSNPFSWFLDARSTALAVAGHWFWDDYLVEASVKPMGRGSIGLAACVADSSNFLLFRCKAAAPGVPGSGVKEIVRVWRGEERIWHPSLAGTSRASGTASGSLPPTACWPGMSMGSWRVALRMRASDRGRSASTRATAEPPSSMTCVWLRRTTFARTSGSRHPGSGEMPVADRYRHAAAGYGRARRGGDRDGAIHVGRLPLRGRRLAGKGVLGGPRVRLP